MQCLSPCHTRGRVAAGRRRCAEHGMHDHMRDEDEKSKSEDEGVGGRATGGWAGPCRRSRRGRGHRWGRRGTSGGGSGRGGPGSPPRSAASVGRLAKPPVAPAARAVAAPGPRGAPSTRPPRRAERRHLRHRAQPAAAAHALREQPAASPLAANGPASCGAHAHSTAPCRPYLRAPLGRPPAGANRRGCSPPGGRNGPPECGSKKQPAIYIE